MGKRLYVGNLPYDTSEEGLKQAFGQDGRQVTTVHLVMDRETGRPRGFAFVEMANDEDAKKAIVAMDGAEFGGRRLRVNEAEDRRGPARPGGSSGSGSSGGTGTGGGGGGYSPRPAGGPPRPSGGGGGGGHSRPRPNWVDAPPGGSDARKYADKKPQRRPHDEDPDVGGRRGGRRFDDDDDE